MPVVTSPRDEMGRMKPHVGSIRRAQRAGIIQLWLNSDDATS